MSGNMFFFGDYLNAQAQATAAQQQQAWAQSLIGGSNGGHWQTGTTFYYSADQESDTYYITIGPSTLTTLTFADPESSYPFENAGIRAGEIRAWRCWRFEGDFLTSMAMDTLWAPDEPMMGDPERGLGVHAWKSLSKAFAYGSGYGVVIVGQVDLWGEVYEHEHGYRAENAAIVSLDYVIGKKFFRNRLLRRLRKLYCLTATTQPAS